MGKSPGKWIKTVFFGKKAKSGLAKNGSAEKKTPADPKAQSGVVLVNPHLPPELSPQNISLSCESIDLERGISANLLSDGALLVQNKDGVIEGEAELNATSNAEIVLQEQAATKAQAAFRGYLARRAFGALKGIIRLQALIRGHLVRRQAVATFHCMHSIVRFQAVIRGQQVRLTLLGSEVLRKCRSGEYMDNKKLDLAPINTHPRAEKLSRNLFVKKLVASLPSAKPLSLQYDPAEPNSAWSWLNRWSISRFWGLLPRTKKNLSSKLQKKHSNMHTLERETGKSKSGAHKVTAVNSDSNSLHSSSDFEKSKRIFRKSLTHQTESAQENPQNELERVKRSLRKVTALAEENSTTFNTETVAENLTKNAKNNSPVAEVSDPVVAVTEQPVIELPPNSLPVETTPVENSLVEIFSLINNGENVVITDKATEELSPKEEETALIKVSSSKEEQKIRRRKSLPGKQEYIENISQNNSPSVPSYMAATASAKAKLRAQGSLKLAIEGAEVVFDRRHSMPSLANGKLNSPSPRVQKTIIANGKGGNRSDRSLLSSRDGNEKVVLPGWKR